MAPQSLTTAHSPGSSPFSPCLQQNQWWPHSTYPVFCQQPLSHKQATLAIILLYFTTAARSVTVKERDGGHCNGSKCQPFPSSARHALHPRFRPLVLAGMQHHSYGSGARKWQFISNLTSTHRVRSGISAMFSNYLFASQNTGDPQPRNRHLPDIVTHIHALCRHKTIVTHIHARCRHETIVTHIHSHSRNKTIVTHIHAHSRNKTIAVEMKSISKETKASGVCTVS